MPSTISSTGHRGIVLTEHKTQHGVVLTQRDVLGLRQIHPGLRIEPSSARVSAFDLTPDQHIGIISMPGLTIEIQPKIPLRSATFLLAWAADSIGWKKETAPVSEDVTLADLIAILLCRSIDRCTHRGLLHGYRAYQEALQAPRGRILFPEHLRSQLAQAPPIEVQHDVRTPDVLE
ncbi:MAG: 5-methylcytosine restriction system specificity protein McrC, partial [Planctomycetota bacterium]